ANHGARKRAGHGGNAGIQWQLESGIRGTRDVAAREPAERAESKGRNRSEPGGIGERRIEGARDGGVARNVPWRKAAGEKPRATGGDARTGKPLVERSDSRSGRRSARNQAESGEDVAGLWRGREGAAACGE